MVRVVPSFIPAFQPAGDVTAHRYIHVIGTTVFVSDRVETDGAPHHFLGFFQGDEHEGIEAVWAVDVPHGEDPSYGAAIDLYTYFGRASEEEWAVAGRAVQLAEWGRTHRFCGRCGTPTEKQDNDRSMKCPACGLLAYPRLAPAMITLVTRGHGDDKKKGSRIAKSPSTSHSSASSAANTPAAAPAAAAAGAGAATAAAQNGGDDESSSSIGEIG